MRDQKTYVQYHQLSTTVLEWQIAIREKNLKPPNRQNASSQLHEWCHIGILAAVASSVRDEIALDHERRPPLQRHEAPGPASHPRPARNEHPVEKPSDHAPLVIELNPD